MVTPDTVYLNDVQAIGPNFQNGLVDFDGQSKFSSDGSVFATIANRQQLIVMDFDRCTGEFINIRTRWNNSSFIPATQPVSGGKALDFSPNGEFLYVTNLDSGEMKVAQYEIAILNSPGDSVMVSYIDTSGKNEVYVMQLADNGKIYAAYFYGTVRALHVVNNPNLKGVNCGFVYLGQPTYSNSSKHIPNLVNYRLGALAGSGCDTLRTDIRSETLGIRQRPRVFPNPADKAFYVEMPQQGNYVFELYSEQGSIVDKRATKQVDIINVEQQPSGVYFLSVKDPSGKILSTQKVVVRH